MALLGYARVSTADQSAALQIDALTAAGCDPIYSDQASGAQRRRAALDDCLAALAAGDTLVVWKLDRLGRSLGHLVLLLEDLARREIGFRSITEAIDSTTPAGRFMLHTVGALAEFERALIVERTRAGMAAAKSRGALIGRRRAMSPDQVELARRLVAEGNTGAEVARLMGVSRATLYRSGVMAGRDLQK